jgi:flagellar basal-body rod protein FlgF
MIKGLYTSKAGMLSRQRQLEINANNLANINTNGYKKNQVFFRHLIDFMQGAKDGNADLKIAQGDEVLDFSNGPLRQTDNPLDLAVVGDGFFVVQTPQGEVYTRNGNFTLDTQGKLVTQDGYSVMGASGEVQISGSDVRISEDGTITVDGTEADKIRLVKFDDPTGLLKIGGTYFSDEDDAMPMDVAPESVELRQGYLEGSNVSGIQEVVEMIEMYRQFEMAQKAVSTQDQTLEKLINDAGRLV